jgi:hypothetical protein
VPDSGQSIRTRTPAWAGHPRRRAESRGPDRDRAGGADRPGDRRTLLRRFARPPCRSVRAVPAPSVRHASPNVAQGGLAKSESERLGVGRTADGSPVRPPAARTQSEHTGARTPGPDATKRKRGRDDPTTTTEHPPTSEGRCRRRWRSAGRSSRDVSVVSVDGGVLGCSPDCSFRGGCRWDLAHGSPPPECDRTRSRHRKLLRSLRGVAGRSLCLSRQLISATQRRDSHAIVHRDPRQTRSAPGADRRRLPRRSSRQRCWSGRSKPLRRETVGPLDSFGSSAGPDHRGRGALAVR